MSIRCSYSIVVCDVERITLVLRDRNQGMSITNDADNLVMHLANEGLIRSNTALYYYDSEGQLDQILHDGHKFFGFAPSPLFRNEPAL